MKQNERLAICSKCTRRKLDFENGYVCQLTGSVADFKKDCKDFEQDKAVTDTIKVRTRERPFVPLFDPVPSPEEKGKSRKSAKSGKPERLSGVALKKLRRYQSFLYALFGGLLFTAISSVAWTVITATTGFQGVYMALGIGVLVGLAVRFFGAGIYRVFGVLAALLTLLGSLLAYYLSQVGFFEEVQLAGIIKIPDYFNPDMMFDIMLAAFVPLDILFYVLAMLLGYFLAIRRIGSGKKKKLEQEDYKGAPVLYWIRLPLILAGFLLPAYFGYTQLSQDNGEVKTLYYESGRKMSEGMMRNGSETGPWTSWHDNGKIESTGNYSEGVRDSLWHWYDESGNRTSSGMYFDGVENGTWINYFTDGVISDSGTYLDGLKEGLWEQYYETGQLKSTLMYKAGNMHGEKILYNTSGKTVLVKYYENGNLKSEL